MRTLSAAWLKSHPQGPQKAKFAMTIPSHKLPPNPDGTPASISFAFEADTWALALGMARDVLAGETGAEVSNELLISFLEARGATSKEHGQQLVKEHLDQVDPGPWEEMHFEVGMTYESDGTQVQADNSLIINAPGVVHAAHALGALRRQYGDGKINLTAIALGVIDQDEDPEYEDGRELVGIT